MDEKRIKLRRAGQQRGRPAMGKTPAPVNDAAPMQETQSSRAAYQSQATSFQMIRRRDWTHFHGASLLANLPLIG